MQRESSRAAGVCKLRQFIYGFFVSTPFYADRPRATRIIDAQASATFGLLEHCMLQGVHKCICQLQSHTFARLHRVAA